VLAVFRQFPNESYRPSATNERQIIQNELTSAGGGGKWKVVDVAPELGVTHQELLLAYRTDIVPLL
jgi:hypothetical protein